MTGFLIALIAVIGLTLAGRSLLALFDRVCGTREILRPLAEVWGISILLGVSFTSASAFVWSDMGRPLQARFSWNQVALGGVLGVVALIKGRAGKWTEPVVEQTPLRRFVSWFFPLVVGVMIGVVSIQTFLPPLMTGKDRLSITRKAAVLFETGSIDAPELVHPEVIPADARDPLLLPLFERHMSALVGCSDDRWGRVWVPLTYAGLVLCFAGVLERRTSSSWGWSMAIGLALWPLMIGLESGVAASGFILPTACFHGAAVLSLWDALQELPGPRRIRGILLASGLASSACFVSNEGLPLLIVDGLAWGGTVLFGGGRLGDDPLLEGRGRSIVRHLLGLAVFVLFAVFLLTPWMRYRAQLSVTSEMPYWCQWEPMWILDSWSTLCTSLFSLARLRHEGWNSLWLVGGLCLISIVTAPLRSEAGPQRLLILNLVGAVVLWGMADVTAPLELLPLSREETLRSMSLLTPVAVLLIAAVWHPRDVPPDGEPLA